MFSIGQTVWPGLAKVLEESSELNVVLAKLIATRGNPNYFDGRNLLDEVEDELADLLAAVDFFVKYNSLNSTKIVTRQYEKFGLFCDWHEENLLKGQ